MQRSPYRGIPKVSSSRASALGVEKKFFDTQVVDGAMAATWTIAEPATTALSAVAQGDGESNRDGRVYLIDSVFIKGFIEVPLVEDTVNPQGDILTRFVLVHDKQTNGACTFAATDVMDGGQTDDYNAFRNLQFTQRFKVLSDKKVKMYVTQSETNAGAQNLYSHGRMQTPFKMQYVFNPPLKVTMSGTTADIANVVDNSLRFISVTTDASSTLNYQSRVRFRG